MLLLDGCSNMMSKYRLLLFVVVAFCGVSLYQYMNVFTTSRGTILRGICEPATHRDTVKEESRLLSMQEKHLVSSTFFADNLKMSNTIFQQKIAALKKHKLWAQLDPISNCTGREKRTTVM
ncbi:uncharacterized protein LOC124274158 [Haliotis rubra]|uniref:uncharacterized protein LOC124274158 n=1 Tax=Haliotis rubra TaxID=36100 RepID=UPI001EE5C8A0|nr:uncharacterized protein LOC124274158 [Haliotis rubra]